MISTCYNDETGTVENWKREKKLLCMLEVHEGYWPEGLDLAAIITWIKPDYEIILKAV
jgi:hypothetical protein